MHADYNIEVAYLLLSVVEFLGPNRPSRPWNTGQKAYQRIGWTRAERISHSYGLTSNYVGRECWHWDGLKLYARETAVYANPYT